jgi:hypothetical protein
MLMIGMSRPTSWLLTMVRHALETLESQVYPEVPWNTTISQKLFDIWPQNICGKSRGLQHVMALQKRVIFTP